MDIINDARLFILKACAGDEDSAIAAANIAAAARAREEVGVIVMVSDL